MKRLLRNTLTCVLSLVVIMSSMVFSTSADVYESDNFTYQDFGDGVIINSYEGGDTSLIIPTELKGEKVVAISNEAFMGNKSIVSVVIPDTVTSIGAEAFKDCENLYNIELPSTLNGICSGAFYNTAYYNAKSSWVDKVLYIDNYLIDHEGIEETDFEVKEGTLGIADKALYYRRFSAVKLPTSLKFIGSYAFENCKSLKYLSVPNSVKAIQGYAFTGCDALEKIHISKGVEKIGEGAFSYCANLKSADIPETVLYIGDSCFRNSPALEGIVVNPANPKYRSIDGVLFEGSNLLFYPCNKPDKVYTILNGIASLENFSFSALRNLEVLNISASCTDIKTVAFSSCFSLKEINVNDENERYYSVDGVLYDKERNGVKLYPAQKEDKSYVTPEGLTTVFGYAFAENAYLEEITVSEGVTFCGNTDYIKNLKVINLPESLEYISNESFRNCENLETINYAGTEQQWNRLVEASGLKVNVTVNFSDSTSIKPSESITTEATIGTLPDFRFTTVVSTTATDPTESTSAETTAMVTDPIESTSAEVTTMVTEPAESSTATVTSTQTEPAESSTATVTATVPATQTKPSGAESTTSTEKPEDKYLTGDVNLDGKLNIRDATLIQKHLAKIVELTADQLKLADFDLNGKVNIKDATYIQKKIANII